MHAGTDKVLLTRNAADEPGWNFIGTDPTPVGADDPSDPFGSILHEVLGCGAEEGQRENDALRGYTEGDDGSKGPPIEKYCYSKAGTKSWGRQTGADDRVFAVFAAQRNTSANVSETSPGMKG